MRQFKDAVIPLRLATQYTAIALLVGACIALTLASLGAALGLLPWLQLTAQYGPTPLPAAGMALQLALTLFTIALLAFLPTTARVLRLETSHRSFQIGMMDITRAYAAAHQADRAGAFQLSDEFEATRARLGHLRNHPDLGDLEPEILETAAQMSYLSRELAETYSDVNVARARGFLEQRQFEIARFSERLDQAKAVCAELAQWRNAVELEESVNAAQLDRLRTALEDILPELHMPVGAEDVVPAPPPTPHSDASPATWPAPPVPLARAAE